MQIYLLLTDNCNLHCKMCIRGRQVGTEIDIDKLKSNNIMNHLSEHDVVVTGGEPTLHSEFVDVVELLCEKAKSVTITTNGTKNDYISKLGHKDNLFYQVSIDGDSETHNMIRGIGNYEKTFSTLNVLEKLKIPFSVASVVSRKNISSMFELEKALEEFECMRYWRLSYEMPFGSAGFEDMMSADEWNEFVDQIIECAKLRIKIQKIFPFELYNKNKDKLDSHIKAGNRVYNCGSAKNKLYVYPDMTVYPCTCLTDFPLGNLNESSLEEILESDNAKRFIEYKIKQESVCYSCEYLKYCNGGCIGMSYHYFGSLGNGDIRCPKFGEKHE